MPAPIRIAGDRIEGGRFMAAARLDMSRRIVPTLIVLHDTDGAISPLSSVRWFQDAKCRTSAHVVIERDDSYGFNADLVYFRGKGRWDGDLIDTAAVAHITRNV